MVSNSGPYGPKRPDRVFLEILAVGARPGAERTRASASRSPSCGSVRPGAPDRGRDPAPSEPGAPGGPGPRRRANPRPGARRSQSPAPSEPERAGFVRDGAGPCGRADPASGPPRSPSEPDVPAPSGPGVRLSFAGGRLRAGRGVRPGMGLCPDCQRALLNHRKSGPLRSPIRDRDARKDSVRPLRTARRRPGGGRGRRS